MDMNAILSGLGSIAKTLVPKLVPGADALFGLAKSVSAAFTSAKSINGGKAPADAEAAHDALFAKVKAHAEGTLSRLEG
jgi:hypothetical protein